MLSPLGPVRSGRGTHIPTSSPGEPGARVVACNPADPEARAALPARPATGDRAPTVPDQHSWHRPQCRDQPTPASKRLGPARTGPAPDRAADFRFLVRDRAGQLTDSFNTVLASTGVQALKIPPRSPAANAHAERFVLTGRTDLTGRMLIFGERYLRLVLAQYAAHCNGRRPHRSRQLRPPGPTTPPPISARNRSSAGPSPAASSTNTSGPLRSPGQGGIVPCDADHQLADRGCRGRPPRTPSARVVPFHA